jgi:integrase/recombinase XerC
MLDVLTSRAEKYISYLLNVRRYSANTARAYGTDLRDFVKYLKDGNVSDDAAVRSFYPILRDYLFRLKAKGISNRSIARKVTAIKTYIYYLQREGLLPGDFDVAISDLKIDKELPQYLTEAEAETLMDLPQGQDFACYRDRAILELFYQAGLRLAELTSLTDTQIDLNGQLLRVMGKGRKMRVVPFGETAKLRLEQYIEMRNSTFGRGCASLFVNKYGNPITMRSVARIVEKYTAKLREGQKLSPHALRHSFATHLLDNGADLLAISDLLGHESVSTTQVYTHVTTATLKKEYQQAHPRAFRRK